MRVQAQCRCGTEPLTPTPLSSTLATMRVPDATMLLMSAAVLFRLFPVSLSDTNVLSRGIVSPSPVSAYTWYNQFVQLHRTSVGIRIILFGLQKIRTLCGQCSLTIRCTGSVQVLDSLPAKVFDTATRDGLSCFSSLKIPVARSAIPCTCGAENVQY